MVGRGNKGGAGAKLLMENALLAEKNTPDGLRPGPVDNPRIASLDKSVIRKRAPRRVRRHLVCKSLDEELLLRLSRSEASQPRYSGRKREGPEKRRRGTPAPQR